jgi:cytochrome c oxidase subunit 3
MINQHKNHPFHLVDVRPWPLIGAIRAITVIIGIIKWFHNFNNTLFILASINTILIIYQWWRDIVRERTFQGLHTYKVTIGLRWGIILFITSEVFFFISFFWRFFHNRLSPNIELGIIWPPKGIQPFNPLQIPLLNTIILLSSGLTVTWAHHSLIENDYKQTLHRLLLTVILGIYFSILQGYEYIEAPFCISDSTYGSSFFIATGFHGIHVIIGTTFLLVCLLRHYNNHFSSIHHFGFEAAAWYWHFVDVVWLFLYISIYWWGRYLYSIIIIFDFQSKDLIF